jgi:hypothetical protein
MNASDYIAIYCFAFCQKQLKLQQERLTDAFSKSLKYFHDNEKLALQRPKFESVTTMNEVKLIDFDNQQQRDAQAYDAASYRNNMIQQQQQQQLENQNLRLVEEQNIAMRDLEKNIVDVNAIFKDLAILVHDQGEVIGTVYIFILK